MISNKQAICDTLLQLASEDRDILVLCSDSRGSASASGFAESLPGQFIELGIAEQNLVSVAAGLASGGMRPFVLAPAAFLSTRSMEQVKVDICYSGSNVKLIGISGGVSYGPLGMTHHAIHDIAALGVLPGLRVYMPADAEASRSLTRRLAADSLPAYVRVGRSASPEVYPAGGADLSEDRALLTRPGDDVTVIACGDMVAPAAAASDALREQGVSCRVLDMFCIKPLDCEAVRRAAAETSGIVTVEEHSSFLGLGSLVMQELAGMGVPLTRLGLPDAPVVTGGQQEVLDYYGLNAGGIARAAYELCRR